MMVEAEPDKDNWCITGFYGKPNTNKMGESWRLLKHLSTQSNVPWLRFSDFNEIMWDFEKSGECSKRESQMKDFRKIVDECGLEDLRYRGPWFTWQRGNTAENNIKE